MAVLEDTKTTNAEHRTIEQYDAHPHTPAKQANYRIPQNLLDAVGVLAIDSGLTKNDIINLALYNTLCAKGYENKKPKAVKTLKL
jgi:hypothetical protein